MTGSPSSGATPTAATTPVPAGDVEVACLTSPSIDDRERPLVVCVHGFPDAAPTWRHLMADLDEAGYRVAAPYTRGYAPTGIPDDGCVQLGASVADVLAVHRHFGGDERSVLVGHDWGAPIVYGAAAAAPDDWSAVVGMAVPPSGAMGTALLTNTAQLKRSWYVFFFQQPLAEMVVSQDDLAFVEMLWRDWSPGFDPVDELPHVKDALRDPANLTAALGYYRTTFGNGPTRDELAAFQAATGQVPPQPTLYLHGADDGCIGSEVAESARGMVDEHVTIELVPDVGHFLHLEAPAQINARLLEFLS